MLSLEERRRNMIIDMMEMVVVKRYQLKAELTDGREVYLFWKSEILQPRLCEVATGKTLADGIYDVVRFLKANAKVQDWEVM